ncbi:MAG TPA: hypothetical protein VH858_15070 [Hyphomicrobiales bacterium]|jgi:hypothetical protein
MLKQCREDQAEHEMALAAGLKEVAAELRLLEAADLVAFIRTGRFGNVQSLVDAATEMYFKPGTVCFGQSGSVNLSWSGEPSVVLNMEFHHRRVDVYFRLTLEAEEAGVEIEYISFGNQPTDRLDTTRRLIAAIADARFAPAAAHALP